jgi:F-type H+-transporting ATPase subunit gamma
MITLKEVKTRIQSVGSTRQITSAMKMVSSAKLHKAQKTIGDFYLYQTKLNQILKNFLAYEIHEIANHSLSPFSEEREIKKVTIVAFSSNNSLCGSFNANVIKKLEKTMEEYASLGAENMHVIPIGKKVRDYAKRFPNVYDQPLDEFVQKPVYGTIAGFADRLVRQFVDGETDRVEFIYQHFKSVANQVLTRETYLPFPIEREAPSSDEEIGDLGYQVNYIIEPGPQELIDELIPKIIRLKLYTVLLDSMAAEHAARTVAMQIATENADILLQSLKVQYNKSRQQVITNELLDIIGGAVQ